jgi:glycosyltransferase involved in cell wall biosynthesis
MDSFFMKPETPFFSVVIPLYNKEKHIKKTINSVITQSFQNFEIVIVNDGSKDDGIKVVEEIRDPRIRIFNQDNAGVSAARNKGIREARADYIALLDADDLWMPQHLEAIAKMIHGFPDAGIYATAYKVRSAQGIDRDIHIHGLPNGLINTIIPNYFDSVANGENLVWSSAVCVPKWIFIKNDIWFPEGEKYGEDQYVWARIASQYDIAYCKEPSAIYDNSTDNTTLAAIHRELDPHKSFYMIKELRPAIKDKEKLAGFDNYISKIFKDFPERNIIHRSKLYGIKQTINFDLILKHKMRLFVLFIVPLTLLHIGKTIRKKRARIKG